MKGRVTGGNDVLYRDDIGMRTVTAADLAGLHWLAVLWERTGCRDLFPIFYTLPVSWTHHPVECDSASGSERSARTVELTAPQDMVR